MRKRVENGGERRAKFITVDFVVNFWVVVEKAKEGGLLHVVGGLIWQIQRVIFEGLQERKVKGSWSGANRSSSTAMSLRAIASSFASVRFWVVVGKGNN